MSEKKEKIKKVKLTTMILAILGSFFLLFLVLIVMVYRFSDSIKLPNFLSNRIFLPAVMIENKNFITIGEVNSNLASIKRFYENQDFSSLGVRVDFNTADGKKRLKIREKELVNKMIEDRMIEIMAKDRGINISNKIVGENVDRKLNEYGNEKEIRGSLEKLYGWSLGDFEEIIVKPSLYKDELEKWLEKNDGKEKNESSKNKALEISEKLKNGEEFEALAKSVSEGGTSDSGGRLGWFKEDQISVEIKEDVLSLEIGGVSSILESKMGYHIIKLNETKEVDGQKGYDISQIFFPKKSFANWLSEEIAKKKVTILLMGYDWNPKTGMVEFSDKSMDEFEKKTLNSFQGDASLLTF